MQNRYSGDIGDFSKLGLLRALVPCNIPIGINWYLVPDDEKKGDGRHVEYLENEEFRQCDEKLWLELGIVVHGERSVSALQSEDILPAFHYSDELDFSGKKKAEREEIRKKWHDRAVKQLSAAGIIFADPDNGLIVPSAKETVRENKYILPNEIVDYYRQGATVIYYQHKARKPDEFYTDQHQTLLEDPAFMGASGLIVKFKRTLLRYYCFIIQPAHEAAIRKALNRMLDTAWGEHFCLL